MGLILQERQTVFVDTAPFIYFFENHPKYAPVMAGFFEEAFAKSAEIVTSVITYIELLTMPRRMGNEQLAAKYREYLTNSEHISLYPLNVLVADMAVDFRAKYKMKTADSVQLAVSRVCGADIVLTNDRDWRVINELRIISIADLVK